MSSAASTAATSPNIVHGFANHVPLAVALREILPAGYGFSVDQNIDLGVLVSFQGGKPWRDTLYEALAPAGLVAHEQGQMVDIHYPTTTASVAAAVPAPNTLALPVSVTPAGGAATPQPSSTPILSGSVIPSLPQASVQQDWDAEPGDTLHKVLEDWSHRANVEFDWAAEYDYPLQASVHVKGNFENAVRELLTGFESAHPQPIAELHSNPRVGQMVLVVMTRGNVTD